jgi:hypothetical protein
MAISALHEFGAADEHMVRLKADMALVASDPLVRFVVNSESAYLHGFYLAGARGLQSVLRTAGFLTVADRIDEILSLQVGGMTFGGYLSEHRNTMIAHPTFDPEVVGERVHRKAPLSDPQNLQVFREGLDELRRITLWLYPALHTQYPIAARREEDWSKGLDGSH